MQLAKHCKTANLTNWKMPNPSAFPEFVGNKNVPTLGRLAADHGRQFVGVAIAAELERFARKMGFENRMTAQSIIDAAIYLRDQFKNYHLEDVVLFLKRAGLGIYGKFIYGNMAELIAMWEVYLSERVAHAERKAVTAAQQREREAEKVRIGYERIMREMAAKDAEKKRKKYIERERLAMREKCNRDAVTLWNRATSYAHGRIDAATFIAALTPNDISECLMLARRYKTPTYNEKTN